MRDKIDDLVLTGIIWIMLLIFCAVGFFSIALHNMIIDHKCYMMEDEEFFQAEMCKPYWSYRQEENK